MRTVRVQPFQRVPRRESAGEALARVEAWRAAAKVLEGCGVEFEYVEPGVPLFELDAMWREDGRYWWLNTGDAPNYFLPGILGEVEKDESESETGALHTARWEKA